jgi:predicted ATP-binding protein involved in virulence
MRIDRLEIENFKKFSKQSFELHPKFTLLVGDNGSGKTSVLDALAVAIGIWQQAAPGSGWRNILQEEIRVHSVSLGDRRYFEPELPTTILALGKIGSEERLRWNRMVLKSGGRTVSTESVEALSAIRNLVQEAERQRAPLPVLAYYGAGRAWMPSKKRAPASTSERKPQQFDAYRNCLDTPIRDRELNEWFLLEIAAAYAHGAARPGFRVVTQAVMGCIPGADDLQYDGDLKEIVLSIHGFKQPFHNLSAGQRMMLAMVADIAIKAVTLNSYLFAYGNPGRDDPTQVLQQSPGIVLIDELDVHLHPKWQRRVATNLKETFPSIQFVCTSHSPQVIGEVKPEEIRLLDEHGAATTPSRSFGIDSSRILEEVMDAKPRNDSVGILLQKVFNLIDKEDFDAARKLMPKVELKLGPDDPEVTRARTLLTFLESKA